jgi:receptor expression-enhancing protein 5/6
LQDKTNIPKEYIGLGGGVFALLVLVFGVGIASLCRLIGFAYPAFKSFQAIETKIKGDIVQWQVYWIIFSMFQLIEVFQDILVYWIPFYFAFKLAFLLWLMLPQTKGATFMYDAFLKDFLKKQSKIDAALSEAKKQGNAIASDFNTYSTNDSPKNK